MPIIIGVTAGGVLVPVQVDANGVVSVSAAVSSLPSLPAGDNNIGNVDIVTLPTLPAGDNNIGNVDIVTMPNVVVSTLPALPAGTNNIGDVDVLSLGRSINKSSANGSGAITASRTISGNERLTSVTLHFNAAPTTSQAFTIKMNSVGGSVYDTLLASVNPADEELTDYVYIPDGDLFLINGDAIDLAFLNTDGKTYGVQITTENV